jgi:uncharacterized protein YkwD
MKSSLLMITGASIAAALPKVEVVTQTDVVYYTVVQEVVQTVAAHKPVHVKVAPTTSTSTPVVTVTVNPAEVFGAPASTGSSVQAAAPSVAPAAQPSDLASTAVYHHNIHRANNSAPAMTWGKTYAGYAATVAASCKFAHDL